MKALFIVLLNFTAGTLCLILGVRHMSSGLEKASPRLLKSLLTKFTYNVPIAFITGTLLTALVQSSAAVTIITVGFVNSGMIKLSQAVGIIYGANIGTTITAQLMSVKAMSLALPAIASGILLRLLAKHPSVKNTGKALCGLGFMFLGMNVMQWGVPYITHNPMAYKLLTEYGSNPMVGLLIGLLATMLVQSSTATVGITIVLFNAGLIRLEGAIGLMLGDNIGTCITAQLASMGTCLAARRTAWAHSLYNVIGVILAMMLLNPFIKLVQGITLVLGQDSTRLIANAHTVFNLLSAVVFLPFTAQYVRFIEWFIPDRKKTIKR